MRAQLHHHPIHHSLAQFTPSCLLQLPANFAHSFARSITQNHLNPEFESAVCIEPRNQLFGPPPRQANRYLHRVATWIPPTCISRSHCQRKARRTVKTGQRRGILGLPARAIDVEFRQGVCIKGPQGTYRAAETRSTQDGRGGTIIKQRPALQTIYRATEPENSRIKTPHGEHG
jgi:hypothetical protein